MAVRWRGHLHRMFFQDGPYFWLDAGASATVLAKYPNGLIAAVVAPYHAGRVGLVGPHPEADRSWYTGAGLPAPGRLDFNLGYDLIDTTLHP